MSYRMYLDDIREPKGDFDVLARSFEEAVNVIKERGFPIFISFDHDLGLNENGAEAASGYTLANWIIEHDIDGEISIPLDFSFNVHSANPVGAKNIQTLLDNYLKFKMEDLK